MKKYIALIFSLISIFLVISCNINLNEFENSTSESSGTLNIPEGKSLVTVNFSLFNSTSKVAAIPDFSSLDIEKYVVTAKADGQTTQTQEVTAESTAANIILSNGIEWTIIIEGKNLSDKVIVKGEKKFTPTAELNSTTVLISPYQQTSKDGTPIPGSIKLNIEFPQDESSIRVDWYIDGALQGTVNADLHSSKVTKVFEASSIEPGTHRITLNIFNSNEPSEVIIKIYDLVVYSNMESKLWHDNGTPEEKITMTSDDIMPVTLADCAFYVLGEGAINLNGTEESVALKVGKKKAFKFATVQDAVDAIVNADPNGKYKSTIYLDGSIMQAAPDGASSVITIGNGTNKPHIYIKGYDNNVSIFNMTASPAYARIMMIDSNADVEMEGVTLMAGALSGANGGGIYCKGKLKFTGNIATCIAEYGGGLYCDGGNIDFKGAITGCAGNNTGGAIYIKNGTLKVHDFVIEGNSAKNSAGGAYINNDNACKAIFEDGSFKTNTAEKGTGGAITCGAQAGSDNGEYVYNACCKNVQFISNQAKGTNNDYGQGGAIYVYNGRFLALIDCETDNNTAEQIGYGTDKYNGIYNHGVIYFGNTISIKDGLYFNSASAVRLAETVTPASGETQIATIYPSSYTEGKALITAVSGSLTPQMISYFTLSNPNWQIDANGKLKSLASAGSGSISVNNETLTFNLSSNSITQNENTDITVGLDISVSGGTPVNVGPASLASVIDELSIKVYSGTQEITSSIVPGFNISGGTITIPQDMINEIYRVEILGKYNSVGVSAICYFEILR